MAKTEDNECWNLMFHGVDEAELLLTTEQVAEMISQSKTTLDHWRGKGGGPPFVRVGRSVRYRLTQVHEWMNARPSHTSTSDATVNKKKEF